LLSTEITGIAGILQLLISSDNLRDLVRYIIIIQMRTSIFMKRTN